MDEQPQEEDNLQGWAHQCEIERRQYEEEGNERNDANNERNSDK